jgi:hypothetical protein
MSTYYIVPDESGYGSWAIKKGMGAITEKVSDAQTQKTAINSVRNTYAETGDQVIVYGNRKNEIVDQFTLR